MSEPGENGGCTDSHLVHDALLTPVEYAARESAAGETPVWISRISMVTETDDGGLVIEVPLEVDAVELRRNRAITDFERLMTTKPPRTTHPRYGTVLPAERQVDNHHSARLSPSK